MVPGDRAKALPLCTFQTDRFPIEAERSAADVPAFEPGSPHAYCVCPTMTEWPMVQIANRALLSSDQIATPDAPLPDVAVLADLRTIVTDRTGRHVVVEFVQGRLSKRLSSRAPPSIC